MAIEPLNIFFEEPDPDRWIPFDRYPRKFIRRIFRGKPRPGGVMMVALELMRGLDKIGIPYRFNDFKFARANENELVGIIGKPQLLFNRKWKNPVLFGAGVYSHPTDCPDLFSRYPNVKKMLVPGEWMREMCVPYYHDKVQAWPVGIDTEKWNPTIKKELTNDFLIYDKIRWEHDDYEQRLLNPLIETLKKKGLSYKIIRYGSYKHQDLLDYLSHSKAVIFLCEHETQGIAYQQILSTNTPILAWDRGGFWQDPEYFPDRVKYEPVSSVPYWTESCGEKFKSINDFEEMLNVFTQKLGSSQYNPREYIVSNLSLEACAQKYYDIYQEIRSKL